MSGMEEVDATRDGVLLAVRSTDRCNTLTFRREVECYGTASKASLLYCG
jgi:hypothetical protein